MAWIGSWDLFAICSTRREKKRKVVRICLLLLTSLTCQAATHFIRVSAAGSNNGSSWANAFTTIPPTLVSGDVYFIAGGTYAGSVTLASDGTATATLKKANAADNGSDSGWDASYASTQAVISGTVQIANGNITIEGVTGSGQANYGIKIYSSVSTGGGALVNATAGAQAPIWLSHVEFQGTGFTDANGWSAFKQNNTGVTSKGTHISNCYLHDFSQNGAVFVGLIGSSYADYGLLFENNVLYNSGGTTGLGHGQGIQCGSGAAPASQSYWIVRNNDFHNIVGTAMIACLGYTTNDHFRIFNNIFRNDNLSYNSGWIGYNSGYPATSPGSIYFSSTSQSADHILVANNTFYQMSRSTVYISGTATNNTVVNNLWINGNFNIVTQGATGSYNDYYGCFTIISYGIYGVPYGETGQQTESGNPVDANFHLLAGTNAIANGQNLSSEFATDAAGIARPEVGAWDIGAYQYSASAPFVNPPTNLQVTVH
jgi:hypothetical protein